MKPLITRYVASLLITFIFDMTGHNFIRLYFLVTVALHGPDLTYQCNYSGTYLALTDQRRGVTSGEGV